MCSLLFKSVHSPSFEKRLNSNTVWRSLNNITLRETICGVDDGLGNSTLRAKTRDSINSVPNMAHSLKKQYLQIPSSPSHEKRYSEGRDFHKTTIGGTTCLKRCSRCLLQVFHSSASNDQVESENIQVFLSFRGETRAGFTSHLHKKLTQEGYRTFIDNLMKRGENIEEEIIKAIRNSEVSVVVISPGYASSQCCLNELVEILCKRRFGHKVLPVFYHVDPYDVYNQTANFGVAFDGLVENLEDTTDKRVNGWKEALKEVTGISGLVLRQYECESVFIDQVVAEVKQLLSPARQRVPPFVVLACVLLYMDSTHGFIAHQVLNHMLSLGVHLIH